MQGSRFKSLGIAWGWIAVMLLCGCNLVAPLSPIVAKGGIEEADGGAEPGKGMSRPGGDADAGATDNCVLPKNSECDPKAQCGCEPGEQCQQVGGIGGRCVVAEPTGAGEGERCSVAKDCAAGLECPFTGLCTAKCMKDADCVGGLCELLVTPSAPDGARVCVTACDPVTSEGCPAQAKCEPSADLTRLRTSLCTAIRPGEAPRAGSPIGGTCLKHTDCAAGLACAGDESGTSWACTPWCRSNVDCPANRAVCGSLDWAVGASDAVGLCSTGQGGPIIDSSCSLAEPASWDRGPVWTVSELTDCLLLCGSLEDECVATQCPGGEEFLRCSATQLTACAGASTGACRAEYVTGSCCEAQNCANASDLDACDQQFCSAELSAWVSCATQSEACANEIVAVCAETVTEN